MMAIGVGIAFAALLRSLRCIAWFTTAAVLSVWPVATGLFYYSAPVEPVVYNHSALVSITSINLLSSNQQYETVLDHLQHLDSDLIAVLELTSTWDQRIRERLAATHPHCITSPSSDGNFGIGVYSRLDWSFADIVYFDSDQPSIEVELKDQPFRLIATHPIPPISQQNFERRNLQLWSISQAVNDSPLPTAVVGDLNLTPWSPVFHRFAANSHLKRVGRRECFVPTWYAKRDVWPLGLSLDHILITSSLQPCEFQIGPAIGSDHRSVTAMLLCKETLSSILV